MLMTIQNLREIARRCQAGEPLPPPLSIWLGQSLNQYLSHERCTTDEAFGLHRPRGGVPWWMEEAMRQRDAALRELARRFYPTISLSARAREIHKLAVRYASTSWMREREMETLPPGAEGTRRQWLWLAFKSGALMPVGERQLRHLIGS